jgi:alkaline phosphatase D
MSLGRTPGLWRHLALAGLALAAAATAVAQAPAAGLLVTVGEVTDRSAVVWARPPGPGSVEVTVRVPGGRDRRVSAQAGPENDLTVKLAVADLAPATRHAYRVQWRDVRVEGGFPTAPAPGTAGPLRLAWGGDLGGGGRCRPPEGGYAVFRAMAARRPDLFLFVGDTIYADHRCRVPENQPGADFRAADLAGFRAKHRYNRADEAVQAFLRGTAVYAIWDDHEVRNDFSGPEEPLMSVGRRAFLEYWPIQPPADDPHRLYRGVRWGRLVEILILDTRQYRSPNAMPDGPDKTMLGAAQRAWLVDRLTRSDATWKLVVSSVSLSVPTGRTARDSWAGGSRVEPGEVPTGFEHELRDIVRVLAERRVRNLVWLVSDAHRAEVIRHAPAAGLVFHELMAGPLSAGFGRPGRLDDTLNPTRLFGEGGYYNFGEAAIDGSGLTVRIVDAEGRVRFETALRPER